MILDVFQCILFRIYVPFIKCLNCKAILNSKFTHDFVQCSCSNQTFVDGGDEYCRYGGVDMEKIQIIDFETIFSFIRKHYPAYDSEIDGRPL